MSAPLLTIVIPTRNNPRTLPRVLRALSAQHVRVPHRIVVVDDGSDPAVDEASLQKITPYGLQVIHQPTRGVAAARNQGAARAKTSLLLFLSADILPDTHLLERHLGVHRQYVESSVACLGFVTWDPELPPSPFMVFLEHGGSQNAYGEIAGTSWVDPRSFCYGSNVSLKREFFNGIGGFDETNFPRYGWEDLELGTRIARHGGRLYYEPTARGLHFHRISLSESLRRMRDMGGGAKVLQTLHPDVPVLRSGERWRAPLRRGMFLPPLRGLLRLVATRAERRWILPFLYRRVTSLSFYDGVHDSSSLR